MSEIVLSRVPRNAQNCSHFDACLLLFGAEVFLSFESIFAGRNFVKESAFSGLCKSGFNSVDVLFKQRITTRCLLLFGNLSSIKVNLKKGKKQETIWFWCKFESEREMTVVYFMDFYLVVSHSSHGVSNARKFLPICVTTTITLCFFFNDFAV